MIRGADWSSDRNSYRTFGCRAAMEGTPPPLNSMAWAFVWPTEADLRRNNAELEDEI